LATLLPLSTSPITSLLSFRSARQVVLLPAGPTALIFAKTRLIGKRGQAGTRDYFLSVA
jgi:hypothetical protein